MLLIMAGLYIHIPLCRRKCLYCDFYSCGESAFDADLLINCLAEEMRRRSPELNEGNYPLLDTIYIGGGTPSLLTEEQLRTLFEAIHRLFRMKSGCEVTVEVNPDDVTDKLCDVLIECGVNRVSAGIQSLVDEELTAVGRRHNKATALRAMELLTSRFDNCSFDLIFGLPAQTLSSWKYSVDEMMRYAPQHLSCYSLMYEDGTALTRLRDRGTIKETDESLSEEMFRYLQRTASDNGYIQYEISNYAKEGFHSRHNSSYWEGIPYLGVGPSAHSYDGNRIRRANPSDIRGYIKHFSIPEITPFYITETLADSELREEYLLTRLRTASGFSIDDYIARFGESQWRILSGKAERMLQKGVLICKDGHIKIASDMILTSDAIILALI